MSVSNFVGRLPLEQKMIFLICCKRTGSGEKKESFMFSRVISGIICGADSRLVHVEADISNGFPSYTMVGYLASEVRESRDRVITALKNSGFVLKPAKVTVNLSPADFRKEGTAFDLPVAAALMAATGYVPSKYFQDTMMIGELGLDGTVSGVRGVLPLVCRAREQGLKRCIVPSANVCEASVVRGIDVFGVRDLKQLILWLRDEDALGDDGQDMFQAQSSAGGILRREQAVLSDEDICRPGCKSLYDFGDLRGQEGLKQAIETAVAGMHHLLLVGAPGSGKSMAAACVPSILPEMTFEESLEVTKIYSIAGLTENHPGLIKKRPYRQPHHTISPSAMVGGGFIPVPGEISLAHHGVLFLDELAEFNPKLIEMLRQPLENRNITINRVHGTYVFPGDFMLIAAMNPCPCGYYPDRQRCRCSPSQIRHYLGRISFPILDRFDMGYEVLSVDFKKTGKNTKCRTSAMMRENVEKARQIQLERFKNEAFNFNAQMTPEALAKYCPLSESCHDMLMDACDRERISVRGSHKIIRTARTLADLEGGGPIRERHLAGALGMRSLDEKYWQGEVWL